MGQDLTPTFDYSVCNADEKGKLIWAAAEVGRLKGKAAETVIELGKVLAIAQEQLARHHGGTFVQWYERECGLSKDTVYRSIACFRTFESFRNLRKLEVSAMYELAKNDTPKTALKEALKLADRGEEVSYSEARKIIEKHKAKAEPKPAPQPEPKPEPTQPAAVVQGEVVSEAVEDAPSNEVSGEPEDVENDEPVFDPDSLENVQADLQDFAERLRDLARHGRQILGAEGNEVTRPWCGCYSVLTLIQPLHSVARTVLNDLPVGGQPDNPVLAREEAVAKA